MCGLSCLFPLPYSLSCIITKPLSLSVVYVSDVWTVEDVWNSQNIPKSKQTSSGFLSNLFGKSDRRLQVQNNILSKQLTNSQQARKEIERTLREVTRNTPTRNTAF